MKLYAIPDALRDLLTAAVDPDTGEITDPDLDEKMEALEAEAERKLEWLALLAQESKARAKAVEEEEIRLRARRKAAENKEARLKRFILAMMQKLEINKLETDRITLSETNNSRPAIRWVLGQDTIPEEFKKVAISLDGQKAYKAWKANEKLPEGFIVERGTHVRIR